MVSTDATHYSMLVTGYYTNQIQFMEDKILSDLSIHPDTKIFWLYRQTLDNSVAT